jgi:hypothetical protein
VLVAFVVRRRRRAAGGDTNNESDASLPGLELELETRASRDDRGGAAKDTQASTASSSTLTTAEEATQYKNLLRVKIDKDDGKAVLGRGNFGEVFRGRHKGQTVAVKQIQDGADDSATEEFMQELDVMLRMKSEHVIALLGVCLLPPERGGGLGLVMEFAARGSLDRHLVEADDRLGPVARLQISEDIAKGLAYLHSVSILHKDLAARNVLVSAEGACKLADFGLSRVVGVDETYVTTAALPLRWCAPETIKKKKVTQASDCFMLGITLLEVFENGKLPYYQLGRKPAMQIALEVAEGLRPQKPFDCSREVFALLQRLWDGDARARPTAAEAVVELAQLRSAAQNERRAGSGGGGGGAAKGEEETTYMSVLAAQEYQFGTTGGGFGAGAAAEYGSNRTGAVAGAAAEYGSNRTGAVLPEAVSGAAAGTAQPSSGDLGDGYGTLESNRE